jgi:hypothetical protein
MGCWWPILWLVVCAELIAATVTPSDRDTPIQVSISQVDWLLLPCQPLQLVNVLFLSRWLLSFARMRVTLPASQLFACGSNRHGQLGVGDRFDRDIPWPLAFGPYSATVRPMAYMCISAQYSTHSQPECELVHECR